MSGFPDPPVQRPPSSSGAEPHRLSTTAEAAGRAFHRAEQSRRRGERHWVAGRVARRLPLVATDMSRTVDPRVSDSADGLLSHSVETGSQGGADRERFIEDGFLTLFDGASTSAWQMVGSGHFVIVDGRLESVPAHDLGLFWCTVPIPADFVLRLRWLRWRHEDASGVLVRFPRPTAMPVAIERGFEVRIDEIGIPGAAPIHRTGAIFNEPAQRITPHPAHPAAEWNDFEITVRDQCYDVRLNGRAVSSFTNTDRERGRRSTPESPSFIGLKLRPDARVAFRDIRIKAL